MKVVLCLALAASASAFAPQSTSRSSTALQAETGRREALASAASAATFLIPAAANAAAGESPRFSVFGVLGDGTSYSEGAAYGSDQSTKVYSPYSVYGEQSEKSLYKESTPDYADRKKAILAESKLRLQKLPKYIERKEWFNVKDELTRYMYETRGAVRGLSTTVQQKEAAEEFFKAIEATYTNATLKKQAACMKAAEDSVATLDAFTAKL